MALLSDLPRDFLALDFDDAWRIVGPSERTACRRMGKRPADSAHTMVRAGRLNLVTEMTGQMFRKPLATLRNQAQQSKHVGENAWGYQQRSANQE